MAISRSEASRGSAGMVRPAASSGTGAWIVDVYLQSSPSQRIALEDGCRTLLSMLGERFGFWVDDYEVVYSQGGSGGFGVRFTPYPTQAPESEG